MRIERSAECGLGCAEGNSVSVSKCAMDFRKQHPKAKKEEDDGKNRFMLMTESKSHVALDFSSAANSIQ
jgi:hypothetical protein